MKYADVIVPLALPDLFTYSVPMLADYECEVGKRVLVQFGAKKIYTAIVRKVHEKKPDYETKELFAVIDQYPVVSELHLRFWEWIADYYMTTIGEVYAAALPVSVSYTHLTLPTKRIV